MSTPTLEMVAALAGVSRSTVSRVINDSPKVTAEALAAVNAAIEQLGYVPNRAARTLASRRTHSIALVIPENTARFFADPYFASVVQGAAMRLATTDFTLTLLIASEIDPEKSRRYLQAGNVDGALILSHHSDDRSYVALSRNLPVVFGGRPAPYDDGPVPVYVDVDNTASAQSVVELLISAGRRRIATIAGPTNMTAGLDRLEGWHAALAAAGMPTDLVERGDFTPASGALAMERLLDRGEPFDGLFAASAQMADGALSVLQARGISVPRDLGVVTFDDDYFAQRANPPLSTVDQEESEVGRTMAELLMRLINGEDVPLITMMPTVLVRRGSE
ncbi:MAG: LacI family DNA-binding transcriptional regulator [Pseudolysinimonas sp.]|uniref:LacI family DNA-binding transcriptional regulator n=1 Tax=Pseudolysinimonas sp. TaxID=2680009 RepID=UPI0032676BC0